MQFHDITLTLKKTFWKWFSPKKEPFLLNVFHISCTVPFVLCSCDIRNNFLVLRFLLLVLYCNAISKRFIINFFPFNTCTILLRSFSSGSWILFPSFMYLLRLFLRRGKASITFFTVCVYESRERIFYKVIIQSFFFHLPSLSILLSNANLPL